MNVLNLKKECIFYTPFDDKEYIVNKLKKLGYKFRTSSCFFKHNSLQFDNKNNHFIVACNGKVRDIAKSTDWWLNKINNYLIIDNSNTNKNTYLDEQLKKLNYHE